MLSRPGSLIYTLSSDGADAVIRLRTPGRPVLRITSAASRATLSIPQTARHPRFTDDDAPGDRAALAARYLAQEAGAGLRALRHGPPGGRHGDHGAHRAGGGVILGQATTDCTLAQIRRQLTRAAACA